MLTRETRLQKPNADGGETWWFLIRGPDGVLTFPVYANEDLLAKGLSVRSAFCPAWMTLHVEHPIEGVRQQVCDWHELGYCYVVEAGSALLANEIWELYGDPAKRLEQDEPFWRTLEKLFEREMRSVRAERVVS